MVDVYQTLDFRDALVAIAGVSGVLWTGVLILRQLGLPYDNRLRIAGEFFGFGFLGPMAGLLACGKWLQILALAFLLLYVSYPIRNFFELRARLFIKHPDQDVVIYVAGQTLYTLAIGIVFIYHSALAIGACSFVLNFIGFRILLAKMLTRVGPTLVFEAGIAPMENWARAMELNIDCFTSIWS